MVDNTVLNSGTGGDTIATDDIGGIKHQRVKVEFGPDNSAQDVESNADATTTRGLPVETPISTASGTLNALNAAVTLDLRNRSVGSIFWEIDTGTLVGTVTPEATMDNTNWFAIDSIRLDGTIITNTSSFADRAHLVNAGFSQVRIRVSSFTSGSSAARVAGLSQANDIVRIGDALPTGTNTIGDVTISALPNEGQQTMANSISVAIASDQSVISIDDNAGSLTVDAPVATPVNVQIGDGTDTALVTAAGLLQVDGSGVTQPISGTITANAGTGDFLSVAAHTRNEAFKESMAIGGELDDTAPVVATEGNISPVRITAQRGMHINLRNNAGTEIGTTANPLAVTDDGSAILVDGSGVTQPVSGTITASNAAGDVAHDTADSGNPVKIGGVAETTEIAAVADGDRVNFMSDLNGKQVVLPYAVPERFVDGVTAAITGTANTSVIASPGAGLRNYITQILVTNSHASVGTLVEIKDGTTVIYRGYAREDGGGFSLTFPTPLRQTAATALNAANVTTGSNTYVSASGYIAP